MVKKLFLTLTIVLCLTGACLAQRVYTPEKGSAERTAILEALRAPVEKDLKQKISFNIDDFNVQGAWAYLGGAPQTADGREPNYKNTRYWSQVDSGAFDNNVFALLKKTGGKWKVVAYLIGCTDVCYATWWKDHKAPKAIFPYNY
ncbi:MAG TPA: hypothetical protein VIL74_03075 [Pyrinomonadaceae bacterium]